MPQTVQAARQLFLQPGSPGDARRIARRHALAEKFQERELRELDGASVVFFAALVVDGQLFARDDAVLRIVDEFVPEGRSGFGIAAALG